MRYINGTAAWILATQRYLENFKYVASHISTGSGCRITGLAQLHDLVSGEITFQGSIQSTHDQWDSGSEYDLCRLRICVDVEFRCRCDVSAFCCAACKYDFLILFFISGKPSTEVQD